MSGEQRRTSILIVKDELHVLTIIKAAVRMNNCQCVARNLTLPCSCHLLLSRLPKYREDGPSRLLRTRSRILGTQSMDYRIHRYVLPTPRMISSNVRSSRWKRLGTSLGTPQGGREERSGPSSLSEYGDLRGYLQLSRLASPQSPFLTQQSPYRRTHPPSPSCNTVSTSSPSPHHHFLDFLYNHVSLINFSWRRFACCRSIMLTHPN